MTQTIESPKNPGRFKNAGKPATLKDIQAGARVVVHAKKSDAGLVAEIIKLGKMEPPTEHAKHSEGEEPHHDHPTK